MNDYLNQEKTLNKLYNRFPLIENFEKQLLEKSENFSHDTRATLVSVLKEQYSNIKLRP
jgi:hypothetical protein